MIDKRLIEAGNKRTELQSYMQGEVDGVNKFAHDFQTEFNQYRDSLLYTKTCSINCLTEEDALSQVYKNYMLEEMKPQPMGDQAPP